MSTTVLSGFTVNTPSISATATSYTNALQIATDAPAVQAAISAALGSTAGNCNARFAMALSIANGTPYTINLLSGSDQYGNTIAMVHACFFYVVNLSTTTAQILTVGGGTHPVMGSDQATVYPNGGHWYTGQPNPGFSVVTSSSDTLTITNASGTCPANLIVLGRTA